MAQGHRDALAVARGTAWDHGYRLGMRMAEEARNPLPPKRALKPSTRKLLAAFPPAAEEVDLRKELDGLSDAALWEGACALAEDAARADQRRALESGIEAYPPGGAVADWCQQFLEGTSDNIKDGRRWHTASWSVGNLQRKIRTTRMDSEVLDGERMALALGALQGRVQRLQNCLLYTSPSPRDQRGSRMPSSA